LANSEALTELETAIGRFSGQGVEKARRAEAEMHRVRELLEERRSGLRREIRALSERIAVADEDDDMAAMERQLDRTTESLERLRKQQRNVDAAADRFRTAKVRFEALNGDTALASRAFLRQTIEDLEAYLALHKSGQSSDTSASNRHVAAPPDTAIPSFDPTTFTLPPGFEWFPIARIDTARELADVQDECSYTKGVSHSDMVLGFESLRRDILPRIGDSLNPVTGETVADEDAASGVTHTDGMQRIYQAFFGRSDPIYVQPSADGALYTVSSGRHRIKVAMDLGWTAVPVKMRRPGQR